MLLANPNVTRQPYPDDLKRIMSIASANESRQWLGQWSSINANGTPLYDLPGLASELGVAQVWVKDESVRSQLGSFKALGAPIALVRLIMRTFAERQFSAADLFAGKHAAELANFTVISATDGNHGRALAAAAQSIGCGCVIVLHANVSVERETAIAAYGAQIVRITGNYDESVEEAASLAERNSWRVVSDTSYEGYQDIPRDVMQGYGTIPAEIIEDLQAQSTPQPPFTHVFLQGGVGGLAAGIASYLWEHFAEQRPTFIVVEPAQADCLYQSAKSGKAAKATGSVDSVMAGLACGETSPLAWQFLQPCVDFFMTIEDDEAVASMKRLAQGSQQDIPLVAGESAVAGLSALTRLMRTPSLSADVRLDGQSRVLLISTEGATAPGVYEELVGESSDSVLKRQMGWLPRT
ncbi:MULTISPECIES: diaminopropionate ammonia-lyase [unclassified Pseudomonas]|uniref:diaminopropionate ammonia-lyase n=1 Tax=Pseudomonas TaxID=286 RepID=UPI000D9BC4C4|nr:MULTISPECIES: diaminopropionate ammonia-lyase [unclassified Pseudomonas]PYG77973.1 diaminopropionate ammonia-lyase [Pseudomonas sp. RV120224-01c]PYG81579.1 diaminopropionate ammonia-lyase [Pseudomonas sp. RV120224-01b]